MVDPHSPAETLVENRAGSGRREFVYRTATVMGMAAIAAALFLLFWLLRELVLLTFGGVLFGLMLQTVSSWFSRRTGLRHGWSLMIVVLMLVVLLAGASALIGSQLAAQMGEMSQQIPEAVQQLKDQIRQYHWGERLLHQVESNSRIQPDMNMVSQAGNVASRLFHFGVGVIVVLFVGLYVAAEPRLYRKGVLRLLPLEKRRRAGEILSTLAYNLRWWMFGQLISMSIVGLLFGLGLWAIGVPLALSLTLMAFLLEFIPHIGPMLALIPALLLAWTQGGQMALWVLILWSCIQIAEGYIVTPLVQRKAVWLPPALGILFIVLLGTLAGTVGVLFGAPIAVAVMVLVKMAYVEDTLGDRSIQVPGED